MGHYCGDYYRGDNYGRGDYYRGDPGFFKDLFKGVGKVIGGVAKVAGAVLPGPVGTISRAIGGVIAPPKRSPGIIAGPDRTNPGFGIQIHGPGSTGLDIGSFGPGMQGPVGTLTPQGSFLPGCQVKGFRPNKSSYFRQVPGQPGVGVLVPKGSVCVKSRRMNVANPRSLRRAIRRAQGFAKLSRRVLSFVSAKAPKGRPRFKKKR